MTLTNTLDYNSGKRSTLQTPNLSYTLNKSQHESSPKFWSRRTSHVS